MKVLFEHSYLISLLIFEGYYHVTESSSWDWDLITYKAENIY